MYTESFELRDVALYLLYTITDEQLLQIDSDLNAETRNIIREIMSTYETGFGYQLLSLNNSRINFLNLGGLVFKVNVGHYPVVETV